MPDILVASFHPVAIINTFRLAVIKISKWCHLRRAKLPLWPPALTQAISQYVSSVILVVLLTFPNSFFCRCTVQVNSSQVPWYVQDCNQLSSSSVYIQKQLRLLNFSVQGSLMDAAMLAKQRLAWLQLEDAAFGSDIGRCGNWKTCCNALMNCYWEVMPRYASQCFFLFCVTVSIDWLDIEQFPQRVSDMKPHWRCGVAVMIQVSSKA